MTPLEILKAARAKIEKPENWIQGRSRAYESGQDRYCAVGAIDAVVRCDPDQDRAALLFRVAINSATISGWNDAPERTHTDVLKAFDKAIELAQGQQ